MVIGIATNTIPHRELDRASPNSYIVELHEADLLGCSGMFLVEVHDQVRSMDVVSGFPRVVFNAESLPFDNFQLTILLSRISSTIDSSSPSMISGRGGG